MFYDSVFALARKMPISTQSWDTTEWSAGSHGYLQSKESDYGYAKVNMRNDSAVRHGAVSPRDGRGAVT